MNLNPSKELAKEILSSLYWFDKLILGYNVYPHAHLQLCEFIDNRYFDNSEDITKTDKLILMPRGSYKTSLVTIGYPIKSLCVDPNLRVLIVNEQFENSKKYLNEIKWHFEHNQKLIDFYGEFKGDEWTSDEITIRQKSSNKKESSITVAGLGVTKVGMHFDLIILDDLVSQTNIGTKEQMDKVIDYYKYILSILEPNGTIIVIGTRWHCSDLYNHIIEKEKDYFSVFLRKAINPDGTLFFPEVLSKKALERFRYSQGSYIFAGQYMNDPVDDENATFKKEWIKYYQPIELGRSIARVVEMNTYLHIDPARSQLKSGDSTGLIVSGTDSKNDIYVLKAKKFKVTEKKLIDTILEQARFYSVKAIFIEINVFQTTLKFLLQEEMRKTNSYFRIVSIEHTWQEKKEDRIRMLQPLFEVGRVHITEDMKDLEDELLRFPLGQHDDLVDSLSFGITYWKSSSYEKSEQEEGGTLDYFREQYELNKNKDKYYRYNQEERAGFYAS